MQHLVLESLDDEDEEDGDVDGGYTATLIER